MTESVEVRVPDIGDASEVEVIEILVAPGESVSKEQGLVSLESDKATMDVPSPESGVVRDVLVAVGDKVSQGTAIVTLEAAGAVTAPEEVPAAAPESAATATSPPAQSAPAPQTAPQTAPQPVATDISCRRPWPVRHFDRTLP